MRPDALVDLGGVVPEFAPPAAVAEALTQFEGSTEQLPGTLLRRRLASEYRQHARNLALIPDVDAALSDLVAQTTGHVVLFSPSATILSLDSVLMNRDVINVTRGFGRDGSIKLDAASDLPHDSIALIASPGDPLGNLLAANDAVRLARACQWLVIDERYADYACQSLLGLASEFPNVIVLRSLQARLGASGSNAGWAVGSPRAQVLLASISAELPPVIAQAALTAFDDAAWIRTMLSIIRDERSRLYRSLRKLSYLQPLPSWGPFVAARVELGERETLLNLLATREIRLHAPVEPGLERYVRIGIGSRRSMELLRCTLLEIAPIMLGSQLACGSSDPYRLALRSEEFSQSDFRQVEERPKRSA